MTDKKQCGMACLRTMAALSRALLEFSSYSDDRFRDSVTDAMRQVGAWADNTLCDMEDGESDD